MNFKINKTIRIYGDKKAGDKIPAGYQADYQPVPESAVDISDEGWGEEAPARDQALEDRKKRNVFDKMPDFGYLSISIQPGEDRIGELYFNVQYEGPNHQSDRCLAGLNAALPDVRAWLLDLINDTTDEVAEEAKGNEPAKKMEIEIQIDSLPCPKSPHGIAVERLNLAENTERANVEVAVGIAETVTQHRKF